MPTGVYPRPPAKPRDTDPPGLVRFEPHRRIGHVVDAATGCWQFHGHVKPNGYGQFVVRGRLAQAHRAYYERQHGAIADGLVIDHLCRNRRCVNPDHMEAVGQGLNIKRGDRHRPQGAASCAG